MAYFCFVFQLIIILLGGFLANIVTSIFLMILLDRYNRFSCTMWYKVCIWNSKCANNAYTGRNKKIKTVINNNNKECELKESSILMLHTHALTAVHTYTMECVVIENACIYYYQQWKRRQTHKYKKTGLNWPDARSVWMETLFFYFAMLCAGILLVFVLKFFLVWLERNTLGNNANNGA